MNTRLSKAARIILKPVSVVKTGFKSVRQERICPEIQCSVTTYGYLGLIGNLRSQISDLQCHYPLQSPINCLSDLSFNEKPPGEQLAVICAGFSFTKWVGFRAWSIHNFNHVRLTCHRSRYPIFPGWPSGIFLNAPHREFHEATCLDGWRLAGEDGPGVGGNAWESNPPAACLQTARRF
jgi:hypothetical protein